MKKIILLTIAFVTIYSVQAQKKRSDKPVSKEKLNLSEEQKQKAKALNDDYRNKLMELRKRDDITVKEWRNRMETLNKQRRDDMSNLLSKTQKEQIERMKVYRKKMAEINSNAAMEKMKLRLDLNNDQVAKFKKQHQELVEQMNGLRENRSMSMMQKRDEIRGIMEKRRENMRSILTDDQLKLLKEQKRNLQQRPLNRKKRVLS